MKPLYRIEPKCCGGAVGSLGASCFFGSGGMGVSGVSELASLGGGGSVVTFSCVVVVS